MAVAVGATGKLRGVNFTLYPVHQHTVDDASADVSPKVVFAMALVLCSQELGRTACMDVQPTHGAVLDSHSPRPRWHTWS